MFSFTNPGQFFGPEAALDVYKNLPVTTPDGPVTVSVNKYRNANNAQNKGGTGEAEVVKNSLLRVARDATSRAGGAVAFVDVFFGKGSPEAIVAVLETFVSYSEAYITANAKAGRTPNGQCAAILADENLTWQETVQQICDGWIGLDCNGFVGNWLKVVAPEFKLNQNSRSNDVRQKAKAYRTSLDDIEYWDVMCYVHNEHIAAVNDTGGSPGSFAVCQSAGGGPRMNEYKFLKTGPKTFKLAAPTAQDIGSEFYVVSLW